MQPYERAPVLVLLAIAVGAIVGRRRQVTGCLQRFFGAETHPTNLAVFRIGFFSAVLLRVWQSDPVGRARAIDRLPGELMEAPQGLGWLLPRLPLGDMAITLAGVALVGGAVAALLGVAARLGALLCALSMTYVMAAPNYFWKVDHDHQHLVWFALILAAAPTADALSARRLGQRLSARRRRQPPPVLAPGRRYALPLRMVWLALGCIYLFAGIGKLQLGWDWVTAENMRNFLWLHWDVAGWVPAVRVDRWNGALVAAAVGTVLFELAFLPAMFLPRARILLAAVGIVFHLAVRWLFRISHFWTLQVAYVSFIDWHRLGQRLGRSPVASGGVPPPSRPSAIAARAPAAIVVAVFLAGAMGLERGWPFARYPTFGYLPGPAVSELVFEATFDDGRVQMLGAAPVESAIGSASYRLLAVRAMTRVNVNERNRRLRALWSSAALTGGLEKVDVVNVYRVVHSTDPDRPAELRRERVAVFRPESGLETTGA